MFDFIKSGISLTLLCFCLLLVTAGCDIFEAEQEQTPEVEYTGDIEVYEAGSDGEIVINAGSLLEKYDEVIYELQILDQDGNKVPGAEIVYTEENQRSNFWISSSDEDGGKAVLAGSPEEIESMLGANQNSSVGLERSVALDDESDLAITTVIAGAIVVGKVGAKAYATWRKGQAIWNAGIDAYKIGTFILDFDEFEDGAFLYCRSLDDIEGLTQSIASLSLSVPKLIVSFTNPFPTDEVPDEIVPIAVLLKEADSELQKYLIDFIIDQSFRFYGENLDLQNELLALNVYPSHLLTSGLYTPGGDPVQGLIFIDPEDDRCAAVGTARVEPSSGPPGTPVTFEAEIVDVFASDVTDVTLFIDNTNEEIPMQQVSETLWRQDQLTAPPADGYPREDVFTFVAFNSEGEELGSNQTTFTILAPEAGESGIIGKNYKRKYFAE